MRITIDTEMTAIIVPDSYYIQVDRMNDVIKDAGGKKLNYNEYIKSCFDRAFNTQIIRQSDVVKLRGQGKRKNAVKNTEDKKTDAAPEANA